MAWRIDTGEPVPSDKFDDHELERPPVGFGGRYNLSQDPHYISISGEASLLDLSHRKVLWQRKFRRWPTFALHPNSEQTLFQGDGNTIRLLDLRSGQERARLVGHGNRVWDLAVSPDGLFLVSASEDRTVRVWRGATALDVENAGW